MKISDVLIQLIGARDPSCPNDADVLAYSEGRLPARVRARFERHFANCDDCRLVLAFLGREAGEAPAPVAPDVVSEQTSKVLAYIHKDERSRTRSARKDRPLVGFHISYARLASVGLVICAIVAGVVFIITQQKQSPAAASMAALKPAFKNARYSEARISGGFDHSRYAGSTRGDEGNNDDLHFSNAENKVKAETDVESRLMWARVCLARGNPQEAKRALEILDQLAARGVETPLALNDMGVAHFQLADYEAAIGYFSKALDKSPGYGEALFNKALAEERDRRFQDAKRDWRLFIDLPTDESWKAEAKKHLESLQ